MKYVNRQRYKESSPITKKVTTLKKGKEISKRKQIKVKKET